MTAQCGTRLRITLSARWLCPPNARLRTVAFSKLLRDPQPTRTGRAGASRTIAAMTTVIDTGPAVADPPAMHPTPPRPRHRKRCGRWSCIGAPRRGGDDPGGPVWSVPARAAIFGMTALLYCWNLARIGMGNTFYAAAVKSGTESWKAFFFGSLDPGSFITVDKPPAALWVMELSGRIFGFSSWSMLLPEALAGLATVMVLYHLVRQWFGEPAAVFASLALALTPVAVVIFRYNDPDAFLTLLLVLAAWACWRAIETGKTVGLVLSGALVGLAFLDQDARRLHRGPGHRRRLPVVRATAPGPAARAARLGRARAARLERVVGGHRRAVAEERAPLHRRAARTTPSSI